MWNRHALTLMLVTLLSIIAPLNVIGQDTPKTTVEQPLEKAISGTWEYKEAKVSIAGRICDAFGHINYIGGGGIELKAAFDVSGFDYFTTYIGFPDDYEQYVDRSLRNTVTIKLDGKQIWQQSIQLNKLEHVSISVKGQRSLIIYIIIGKPEEYVTYTCLKFGDPKLIKGKVGDAIAPQAPPGTLPGIPCVVCGATFPTQPLLDQHCDEKHRIGIDPRDIKSLAAALRKRVDAKPGVMNLVAKGHVALATFNRIAVYSPATASDIAEDLSTELINLDFPLVERGQLDKVLKELKIQDTGMIDPKTAKQIGQLAGCDLIIVGSISDQGQFVVINCRLLETATGKALAAEQVEMRKSIITR